MAQQTTVLFEHRHTHDQAFLRSFYWHSLTLSPSYMLLWAGLFAVGMVLAVQSIREGAKGTGLLCGVAALVCLLRGFLVGWIRLQREYKTMAKEYGKDGWGALFLRKADFSKGTAAEFCAWLAQEHPEIPQSVKR